MFPTISDLINHLFGTSLTIPIQSYGFMVAMAFLSGSLILYAELKRKERAGEIQAHQKKILKGAPATVQELLFNALFGFVAGWKGMGILLDYGTFSQNPQQYIFSGEGIWWAGVITALAFAGYVFYQKHRVRLEKPAWVEVTVHPRQLTLTIVLIAAVSGILGAKVFDTVEHIDDLVRDPLGTLFSFSGLSFYGGLILASFTVVWYCEKNKITLPYIADAIAPALILAYAVGRIGCQLSGDGCWGIVNTQPMPDWLSWLPSWVWSFEYPHNVIDQGVLMTDCRGEHCHVLPYPVYPTPLYETTMGLIIFGILWGIRKRLHVPGFLFCIYLILNGTERFLIERIRVNAVYSLLGLPVTQAQVIAVILVLTGIAGFWYFLFREKKRVKELAQTPGANGT